MSKANKSVNNLPFQCFVLNQSNERIVSNRKQYYLLIERKEDALRFFEANNSRKLIDIGSDSTGRLLVLRY